MYTDAFKNYFYIIIVFRGKKAPKSLIISFSSDRFLTHHVGRRVLPLFKLMQITDKQTLESHSKHAVLCIQIVRSTIADWAAKNI